MSAKFTIADESRDNSASVFNNKSLSVGERYQYFSIPSGTATGVIFTTGGGVFHSIVSQATGGSGNLWLWDVSDTATAPAIGASASAVARYNSVPQLNHVYDAIVGGALIYRLSAINSDGITVMYTTGS